MGAMLSGADRRRYDLIVAAGRFLMTASVGPQDTQEALAEFVASVRTSRLHPVELDGILVRCLVRIQQSAVDAPGLVDSYFASEGSMPDPVERFRRSIDTWLAARLCESREMQRIAAYVRGNLSSRLTSASIGAAIGMSPALVRSTVASEMEMRVSRFVRSERLTRAAEELRSGTSRVKEIWALVGYNDASNFTHDFKQQYGQSPSEYRAQSRISSYKRGIGRAEREPSPSAGTAAGRTVLIVDDDIGMRDTVGRYLQTAGYRVVTARTGSEALLESHRQQFDAGLVDYHLPDMDGIDCLNQLTEHGTVRISRFVLFTADWNACERSDELNHLGVRVLSKLSDLDEISAAIDQALTT